MLIYIKGEKEVKKNRVVKIIEIVFILLSGKNELVIFVLITFTVNSIIGSTVYTILKVNN